VSVVQSLVYVSGAPGAGKSTLAGPLAAELGFALLGKDRIKETLGDWLGAEPEPVGTGEAPSAGAALPGQDSWPGRAARLGSGQC
jgi:predicted kinase